MKIGKVLLVGAGPGDPELMTLKALQALQSADIVLYDRLVSKEILEKIPKDTKKINVGKKAGSKEEDQLEINKALIKYAQMGKLIVRLKGGDPFIFGRGGEEALALKEANIPFKIIPGLSSALTVPIVAGIPLTHREYASSITIATGQEDPSKPEKSINWERLASTVDTFIILMGVKNLGEIIERLQKGGMNSETNIAIIESGTTFNQRITIGSLNNILQKAVKIKIKPPAVIVIGDVVKLYKELL